MTNRLPWAGMRHAAVDYGAETIRMSGRQSARTGVRSTDTMASILDSGEQAVAHSLADLGLVEAQELRVHIEVMLPEIGRRSVGGDEF